MRTALRLASEKSSRPWAAPWSTSLPKPPNTEIRKTGFYCIDTRSQKFEVPTSETRSNAFTYGSTPVLYTVEILLKYQKKKKKNQFFFPQNSGQEESPKIQHPHPNYCSHRINLKANLFFYLSLFTYNLYSKLWD